jgi:hypothetical protein
MACAQRRGACGALMPQLEGATKLPLRCERRDRAGPGVGRECPQSQAPLSLGSLLHGNRSTGRNFRFMLGGGIFLAGVADGHTGPGPGPRQPESSVLRKSSFRDLAGHRAPPPPPVDSSDASSRSLLGPYSDPRIYSQFARWSKRAVYFGVPGVCTSFDAQGSLVRTY